MPITRRAPASKSASACPPAPSVASITTRSPPSSSTTSSRRTGTWSTARSLFGSGPSGPSPTLPTPSSEEPHREQADTEVQRERDRRAEQQPEALPQLLRERASHGRLPGSSDPARYAPPKLS